MCRTKSILFLFIACWPAFAFSQNGKVIETPVIVIKETPEVGLSVKYRATGSTLYLFLTGYGQGTFGVDPDDQAIFLLENDHTVTVKPAGPQKTETSAENKTTYNLRYQIGLNDLSAFSKYNIKSVRIYTSKGFTDIDISGSYQQRFKELSMSFLKQLQGETAFKGPVHNKPGITNSTKIHSISMVVVSAYWVVKNFFISRNNNITKNKLTQFSGEQSLNHSALYAR
ncbi:MAG: hypothetical protein ICV65_08660 [Flavisolibacter sp.]|nr:hypothetical protein [Flavisolibacter sp.]